MITAWSKGEEKGWQAQLWRHVVSARQLPQRVELMRQLKQRLISNEALEALPERVSLFALSRLEPAFFEIIHALAARCEILLFQHNPTDQYWADLVSKKSQARKRLQDPR